MLLIVNNYANKLPSDINVVCRVTTECINHIKTVFAIMDEDYLFDVKVILNELLLNAILHGNKCDKEKTVFIKLAKEKDVVRITVEDEGQGYDYKKLLNKKNILRSNLDDICNMSETGRGIHIVKNLSDALLFNKKGNRITAIKRVKY